MAAGIILFLACIVLFTTGFTFPFLYVLIIDWAILGMLFVFVVLPLLEIVAFAIKFSEKGALRSRRHRLVPGAPRRRSYEWAKGDVCLSVPLFQTGPARTFRRP